MLHIIAFDVPYPANYGGAIDVYYKIKALHAIGEKITLHCFTYRDRQPDAILENFCEKVFYYKRKTGFLSHLNKLPYIVQSRKHPDLLKNLCTDDAPILFEGLHTCAFIDSPKLENRNKMVRMHNIEWQYYQELALTEKKLFQGMFFRLESWKLKKFEKKVFIHGNIFFCISSQDKKYFFEKYFFEKIIFEKISKNNFRKKEIEKINSGLQIEKKFFAKKIIFLPPFHAQEEVISKTGRSFYIMYHGDLSVNDNEKTVLELIENVFSKIDVYIMIAGKNPSKNLFAVSDLFPKIHITSNPDENTMRFYIKNAHIHILHAGHTSGMKLKLLHALFVGRFCFANKEMVAGTGLESMCQIYNSFDELKEMIIETMHKSFEEKEIVRRKKILEKDFSNSLNALIIQENL